MENLTERPMSEYLHQIPVEQVVAKKRWTRDDWIVFALDVLEKDGLAAVRIEELARRGQRTPGSFYAHFKTRDELLAAMLDAWLEFKVENSMRRDSQLFHTGKFTLENLAVLFTHGFQINRIRLELAVRDWALKDERARKTVMQVDSTRLTNSTAMLRAEFPDAAHPQVFPLLFIWMLYGRNLAFFDPKNKALVDSVDLAAGAFVQMYQSTAGKFKVPGGPTWEPLFKPWPDKAAPVPLKQEMDFTAPSVPKAVTHKRRRR
jgi:AcrR family transcriptional regulator